MESLDCLVHQVPRVSLDSLVSLVYQEPKETLDSQASDSQDPQELKDSQGSPDSQDLLQDQADQEWTDYPASPDLLDPRVNPASDFLVLLVYQESLDLKVSLDQREILVSPEAQVHQDDLDLTELQVPKVSPVHLVYLELVAHLDPPALDLWDPQAPPDLQVQWDHQDSLDQMERKETLALQV